MRKVTVSRMRERYAPTVLTFRITYVNTRILLFLLYYLTKDITVINGLSGNAIFCALPHKGTFSKQLLNIRCVFGFSLRTLTEAFNVRWTERDIIINEHKYSCKVPVIIATISLKLNFLNRFSKNTQALTFEIFVQCELSCSMLTNGPTDTHTRRNQ